MANTKGLVVVPSKTGELQIPQPLMGGDLQSLVGQIVAMNITHGCSSQRDINRRVTHPAALFLDIRTPLLDRLHHVGTFLPQGSDLHGLLKWEEKGEVTQTGKILLPTQIQNLFSDTNRRARIILLKNKGGFDGFALSFEQTFPSGSNGRG